MTEPKTEQEWADYYQAHKEDPGIWGDPEPPPRQRGRPSRGLKATITVRFTEDEAAIIRHEAEATGSTYSESIRRAVRAYADKLAEEARREETRLTR